MSDYGPDELMGDRHDISREGPPRCCNCGNRITGDVAAWCVVCDRPTGPCCITEIGELVEACHEHESTAVAGRIADQREQTNLLRDQLQRERVAASDLINELRSQVQQWMERESIKPQTWQRSISQ